MSSIRHHQKEIEKEGVGVADNHQQDHDEDSLGLSDHETQVVSD